MSQSKKIRRNDARDDSLTTPSEKDGGRLRPFEWATQKPFRTGMRKSGVSEPPWSVPPRREYGLAHKPPAHNAR